MTRREATEPGSGGAARRTAPVADHVASPEVPVLDVRELRTYFETDAGTARAVDGVSFTVDRGEALGLVGESGSGKSVTALSILRLVPEPPGHIVAGSSIRLRGRDLMALPERSMCDVRGNDVGMVFQEPMTSLNPVQPVGEQVAEPIRRHLGFGRRAARERAIELLGLVGIPEPAERVAAYPHQLSGGMRQRVMIAMALACDPALLIADEPTTALDVTIQAQILDLLRELRARLGMALILITHDLGVVAEVCDRVAVMYAGQIVETGGVGAVFRKPCHPYTEGLLRAMPRLGRSRAPGAPAARLVVIPGSVPDAVDWPAGCRFRPRCPYAWPLCGQDPPLVPAAPQGSSRCWLESHPERRAALQEAGQ
jgi:oligopeptide/dipeptide ABC transporter ATP-binding protein